MKKIILIAALGVFGLTSCTKDFVCQCTTRDSAEIQDEVIEKTPMIGTRKNLKETCEKKEADGSLITICKLF